MSSVIKTHTHENYDILKYLTESNSTLLYKGKPISGVDSTITISPDVNNILEKRSNGYYVPGFIISKTANNGLTLKSDGYYVPTLPIDYATTDDINEVKKEISQDVEQQIQIFDERCDIITTKIQEIASNTTKTQIHEYYGDNSTLESVIDITTLYNLSSDVILNLELMIKNVSDSDILNIRILENNMQTLNDALTKSEIQRYKLPNIPNIEIFIKGNYQLFLYVTYV